MCRDLNAELRNLNLQVSGSMREVEMHRLVHTTLRDAVKIAYRAYYDAPVGNDSTEYTAARAAEKAWDEHLAEHKRQGAQRRSERVK